MKYNSKIGSNNGFDGVYIKGSLNSPGAIIINEAKQVNAAGSIKLNPGNTNTGLSSQMSDSWIDATIDNMRFNSDPSLQQLGMTLKSNRSLITKTITAVDKNTSDIIILKLDTY